MTALQQEVIELISKNYSVSEISKILNRSQSSISSIIKRFNIVDYKKLNVNTCNNTYFDKIDNEIWKNFAISPEWGIPQQGNPR